MSQVQKFCRCIKAVRNTVKLRRGTKSGKEKAAIAICTKSILQSRGRTMKKFKCRGKAYLKTQPAF